MSFGTVTKCTLVTAVLLLSLPNATEAFSLNNFLYDAASAWFWSGPGSLLKAVSAYFGLGGGTVIVYDALNYNYFGVGPAIREWLGVAVKEGGSAIAENSLYLFAKIVVTILRAIVEGIGWLISSIANMVGNIIWSYLLLLIPTITPGIASLAGFAGFTGFAGFGDFQNIFGNITNSFSGIPGIVVVDGGVGIQADLNKNDLEVKNAFPKVTSDKEGANTNIRSLEPKVSMLRGRRDSGTSFDSVRGTFIAAASQDRLQCLPLVLCAIYADPGDSVSPLQSQFKKEFRLLFPKKNTPIWASPYITAADLGETVISASECQAQYPSCPFSSGHLKRLIFKYLDAEWSQGKVNRL
ncbi:uncharacterized protein LOC135219693 [Macrobrachium nipponense]|uniref:uncharacterized protein LOC135219693 n=1 Tax=Macrobrachium nipponense TaxID=159736 RepID=UPI0030C8AB0A